MSREEPVEAVQLERNDRVALLRLNRPKNLNALSQDIKDGLARHVPALIEDESVGCIVLTGTEGAFCAGGDIANMTDRNAPSVRDRLKASHRWVRLLLEGETPVVAAVNGAAAGAGFSLAMLCDVVLVSESAYFKPGFPGIGAVPDLGLAMTLPRAVGMARARELLLTNRRVDAAEAVAIGIASRSCAPDALLGEAMAVAAQIAAGPRPYPALTKLLLNEAYGSVDRFLFEESLAQAVAFGSTDFAEGVDAFLSKRRPQFGR